MSRPVPKDKDARKVERELDELERLINFHNTETDRLMRRYAALCKKYGVALYDDAEQCIEIADGK